MEQDTKTETLVLVSNRFAYNGISEAGSAQVYNCLNSGYSIQYVSMIGCNIYWFDVSRPASYYWMSPDFLDVADGSKTVFNGNTQSSSTWNLTLISGFNGNSSNRVFTTLTVYRGEIYATLIRTASSTISYVKTGALYLSILLTKSAS